jgi:iron complex outermembrane receptor protein
VYRTKARSEAGYAQASYQINDALKLTGGVRYTHDYKSEVGYYGDLTNNIVYANQSGSTSSSKPTFHAEIEDKLSPANFVYVKFDTGYKAGGFNFGGSSYKPESIKSYEIGSKNRFFGDKLQLNVAAFYSDYTNQQVSNYAFLDNGEPVQLTQNAGSSHIYGLEGDLIYSQPEIGRFNLTVNYLHARYTDFLSVADPSDPAASGNVQLKGNRPPQSPTWNLAAGLEHDWQLAGGTLTGRIQTKFQTASNFSFYNFADTRQDAYTMSDAFLTYTPGDKRWSVTAFVKNLENNVVFSDAEESQYALAYTYEFYPPRTYGVRVQYNW